MELIRTILILCLAMGVVCENKGLKVSTPTTFLFKEKYMIEFRLERLLGENRNRIAFPGGTLSITWPGDYYQNFTLTLQPMNGTQLERTEVVIFDYIGPNKPSRSDVPKIGYVKLEPSKLYVRSSFTVSPIASQPDLRFEGLIALFGRQAAGKSTFILTSNMVCSSDHIWKKFVGLIAGQSVGASTMDTRSYATTCGRMIDTMGESTDVEYTSADIHAIMTGRYPNGWNPIDKAARSEHRLWSETSIDRAVFLIDAGEILTKDPSVQSWETLWGMINDVALQERIPSTILITHLDLLYPELLDDVNSLFNHAEVKKMIEFVQSRTGCHSVFPVILPGKKEHYENPIVVLPMVKVVSEIFSNVKAVTPRWFFGVIGALVCIALALMYQFQLWNAAVINPMNIFIMLQDAQKTKKERFFRLIIFASLYAAALMWTSVHVEAIEQMRKQAIVIVGWGFDILKHKMPF